jgi:CRISPR system Cascade subunit CasB
MTTVSVPPPPSTRQRKTDKNGLVDFLISLARQQEEHGGARGELAALRQSLQEPLKAAPYVARFLGDGDSDEADSNDSWLYTIAGLFGWHRNHQKRESLGHAFRRLRDKTDSDSIEQRFIALISTDRRRLREPLRHAIQLLASHNLALDWYRLTDDILYWNTFDKKRQHQLARDFYRAPSDNDSMDANSDNPNTQE